MSIEWSKVTQFATLSQDYAFWHKPQFMTNHVHKSLSRVPFAFLEHQPQSSEPKGLYHAISFDGERWSSSFGRHTELLLPPDFPGREKLIVDSFNRDAFYFCGHISEVSELPPASFPTMDKEQLLNQYKNDCLPVYLSGEAKPLVALPQAHPSMTTMTDAATLFTQEQIEAMQVAHKAKQPIAFKRPLSGAEFIRSAEIEKSLQTRLTHIAEVVSETQKVVDTTHPPVPEIAVRAFKGSHIAIGAVVLTAVGIWAAMHFSKKSNSTSFANRVDADRELPKSRSSLGLGGHGL
jgi:hypothetical protein